MLKYDIVYKKDKDTEYVIVGHGEFTDNIDEVKDWVNKFIDIEDMNNMLCIEDISDTDRFAYIDFDFMENKYIFDFLLQTINLFDFKNPIKISIANICLENDLIIDIRNEEE